jgi:hypothetical protein
MHISPSFFIRLISRLHQIEAMAKEKQYTKKNFQAARNLYLRGWSYRNAAKDQGIPPSTFWDRMRGSQPKKAAYERFQKLSAV